MLKTAGFVDTKRGVGGSFLIKDSKDITLLDIFKSVGYINSGSMF
jgi:DNA-binding IscR family transcriptional regulator